MPASIYDVAKRAGVSISTVSRILNGSANVSDKKAKAVRQAMADLDYVPNQFAQGLMNQTSGMVGIYLMEGMNPFDSVYDVELMKGANEVLSGYNISMVIIQERPGSFENRLPRYMEYLRQKKVDGLILAGLNRKEVREKAFAEITEKNYSVAYIGKRFHEHGLNVYAQFEKYNMQKIRILYEAGHRKILVAVMSFHKVAILTVIEQCRKEMPDLEMVYIEIPLNIQEVPEVLKNALRMHVLNGLFTAVSIDGMEDCRLLLSACQELNIFIPKDLSIISVEHRLDEGASFYPQISNVYVPAIDMGRAAAELVMKKIRGERIEEQSVEFESPYIERGTVRRIIG